MGLSEERRVDYFFYHLPFFLSAVAEAKPIFSGSRVIHFSLIVHRKKWGERERGGAIRLSTMATAEMAARPDAARCLEIKWS